MKNIQRTLAALLLAAAPAFAADGVAFITNLKGEVAVDGNPRPVLLSELARGQKVSVGRESQASVMFIASGKEYVLKGPNEFVVKEIEMSSSSGMPPITRETEWRTSNKVLVQVAQTSAASVRMRSAAVPKPDTAAKLLYPTAGAVAIGRGSRCYWRLPPGTDLAAVAGGAFGFLLRRAPGEQLRAVQAAQQVVERVSSRSTLIA